MHSRTSLFALIVALSAAPATAQQANPAAWPAAESPAAITDAATEAKIDALIGRMTVEQKVGQTVQGDISSVTPADLARYPLGSILAGGNSGPYGNERSTAQDWHRLTEEFRDASMKTGLGIPVIFGIDAVHGHSNVPGATIFPHNIGLGAAHDPDLIRRIGEATAAEVAATGIEWTFAPTLAVPQDGRWGRAYEGYSSDPDLVRSYAAPMTLGVQGELVAGKPLAPGHIAATAKHFLADGGTKDGKDQGDAEISEAELVRIHNAGYPASIEAGALTVMVSFSSWNGVKHHGNKSLLTDVLKGRMGFAGLSVGDWNAHGQIPGCTTTDCPQAINAGLDMYMAPDSWKGLFESLVKQVKAGEVSMARLDDAVRRILRVKAKLGMLEAPRPAAPDGFEVIGSAEHLALAREAVAKSLVLLKNNGSVLPIKPGAKVLVAGAGADSFAKQAGGWTISWQGTDVTAKDMPNGQTIYAGIAQAVKDAGGAATLSKDGAFTAKPDVAIVVYGEDPYAEFQGDVPTLDYQPVAATDLALLKKLKSQGIPVVSVFLSGRPMFTNPEINASDAFVAAWLPGSQGAGVADVLVARKDGTPVRGFTGTLSFPWPKTAAAPVTDPLWPLGYGLKYGEAKPVAQLSEDPGVDIAAALNVDRYFDDGRALSPWAMSISDAGGARPVASPPVDSPAGAIATRSVDLAAQEDAKQVTWTGKGSGTLSIAGPAADLNRQLTGAFALAVDWRIDKAPARPVTISFGDRPIDITGQLKPGQVTTTQIPLRCFAEAGADITRIGTPFAVTTDGAFAATIAHVRLEPITAAVSCPAPAS
ncbi:glycoside hydrolase family 3 protein [Sphingomonas gilva]|uniref:Glycoside hydrolase family 3 protein n=1 Tax=Sphingomonas gilva TaxID=2305907 RepID=A0A396RQX5_9SPHN|nr:exo 1,3/1,4-beta-D-glucan glucohydrolase [Sphingomonas gilva]RHW16683.1 glycoside hydrolase family 3 protein [Sphingomonas gilva]